VEASILAVVDWQVHAWQSQRMMKQKSNEIRYPSEEESHRAVRLAVILVLVGMALLLLGFVIALVLVGIVETLQ